MQETRDLGQSLQREYGKESRTKKNIKAEVQHLEVLKQKISAGTKWEARNDMKFPM